MSNPGSFVDSDRCRRIPSTRDEARKYLRFGRSPVPIPRGHKGPRISNWQNLKVTEATVDELFGEDDNIGIRSENGFVDVDLDAMEAVQLANYFLPKTGLIHGRESKPASHYWYEVEPPPPVSLSFKDVDGTSLLELRSFGHQTVVPPSVHPSGEQVRWDREEDPSRLPAERLDLAVRWHAVGTLLLRHWPAPGSRHDASLALSGLLLDGGCTLANVGQLVSILAALTNDDEERDRENCVLSTAKKLEAGGQVAGAGRLAELLGADGKKIVRLIIDWLGLTTRNKNQLTLTDAGNALRFVRQHGNDVRFCPEWGTWLVYKNGCWRRDADGEVERRAKETARTIYGEAQHVEDTAVQKAITNWARQSQSRKALRDMMELAKSEPGISIGINEFDSDPAILNCENGTVDLRTAVLRPHRREDYCSKQIPMSYVPASECPIWLNFLNRIMGGSNSLIEYLQIAVGYSITGDTREHALFLLHGDGANGKTTFVEMIRAMLGPYGLTSDPTILLDRGRDGISNDIARLAGSRFVSASETPSDRRMNVNVVKSLTGGDTISARFLYRESFEFRPQFKIWLATNNLPIIQDSEIAVWRRVKVIPFTVSIPPEEQDKNLSEKLKSELQGILAWAVQGCIRWRREGLKEPAEIKDAVAAYRADMDRTGSFLTACCTEVPHAKTAFSSLFAAYTQWCTNNGEEPVSQREFGRCLAQRGFHTCAGARGVAMRKGIALLDTSDGEAPF